MNWIKLLASSAVTVASLATAEATVTIVFNAPFFGGVSSNLADTAGVVTNGMKYGILVDTASNGFHSWSSSDLSLLPAPGGARSFGDDRLYLASDQTSDSSQGGLVYEGDFVTPGGNGGVSGLVFSFSGSVAAGQSFVLIWFDEVGAAYGVGTLSSSQYIIPSDGSTVTYDQEFVGVDPVRSATQVFPEPSSLMLGALGALGLLRRRRNS